jgi:TRAP transporter TAXI family solute receptor
MTDSRPLAPSPAREVLPVAMQFSSVSWRDLAQGIWPIVLLTLVAFVLTVHLVSPAPPHELTMSTGPLGSTFAKVGERYREILARDGITLNLVNSEGSLHNLNRLSDPHGNVDIALVQSGMTSSADVSDLVSLGSMFYEPLRIFYRGASDLERLSQLRGERIAVGPEGSGVRVLALALLKANGIEPGGTTLLVDLEGSAATEALLRGRVDAVLLTGDSASYDVVRQLLHADGIRMFNFARADAYVRRFPYLSKLAVPEGAFDLGEDLPRSDVNMLAPTVELVAHAHLHPALIDMLLGAAFQVHSRASVLQSAGQFPNVTAYLFPLHDEALRYYRTGNKSLLYRYLPFWLASLLNRALIVLLPVVVVLIPGLRLLPQLYRWRLSRRIHRRYSELMALERETLAATSPAQREELRARLDHIEKRVIGGRMPGSHAEQLYHLREHIEFVRENLERTAAEAGELRAVP